MAPMVQPRNQHRVVERLAPKRVGKPVGSFVIEHRDLNIVSRAGKHDDVAKPFSRVLIPELGAHTVVAH